MKTIYLECKMGAAGDMLCAALYELLDDAQKRSFVETMNGLGLPGVSVIPEDVWKQGVKGTHYTVVIGGEEEEAGAADGGQEDAARVSEAARRTVELEGGNRSKRSAEQGAEGHGDGHSHSSLHNILSLIDGLPAPQAVRERAAAVYDAIARAEGAVHGETPELVHFHEVGALDAVADVVGFCLLAHLLEPDEIVASPVNVGSGFVRCAHGLLPVPAPATARLLADVPSYAGAEVGELCTPTGAALLAQFTDHYGPLPCGKIRAVGYGMGRKNFAALNCVRAMLLESGQDTGARDERVCELRCNLDDMTPESLAFACEELLASGALDVWCQPITMKKGRTAQMLCCLVRAGDEEQITAQIFRHTTTLGVRRYEYARTALARTTEKLEMPMGTVRVKRAEGCGVERGKPEYEDLARIAREKGLSLAEVRAAVEKLL